VQIILVLWYLNFRKPSYSLSNIEKGIITLTEGQKQLGNGQEYLVSLIQVNTQKITNLQKNDSIQSDQLNHYPASHPIPILSSTRISSEYRERINPITGKPEFHWGIDYTAPKGSPVFTTAAGVVEEANSDGGYGNLVKINHGNGYESSYAHLSNILVKINQKVKRGDLIGKIGMTGLATGYHLHYEITYKGEHINPEIFYRRPPLKQNPSSYKNGLLSYQNALDILSPL
jgi:murein DD-endopeptidase MepM/ murein hydrolase activator NlpD